MAKERPQSNYSHLLLTLCWLLFQSSITNAQNTAQDVIIVGAGAAGMSAAKVLVEAGYEVLIIEATDRIGGRVYSTTLGNTRVELGAEEHYLARNNPVWPALVNEYGPSLYARAFQGVQAFSMDEGLGTCWYLSSAARDCNDDPDLQEFQSFRSTRYSLTRYQDTQTTYADEISANRGVTSGSRGYHLYDSGFAGLSLAAPLSELSAFGTATQSDIWDLADGTRVIGDKDLGYSDALTSVWWQAVLEEADLLLERPVVRIDTSGDFVIVTDQSGDQHWAQQVIVTVSIGVLQAEVIDFFFPNLPEQTVAAYQGIGFGMGMKIPLRFDNAWWETEGVPMSLITTEGLAANCWAPTDYKVDSDDFILMCYPMGDQATALNNLALAAEDEQIAEAAIIEAVLADLDSLFPEAPNAASQAFIEGRVQNWGGHPFTRGAYSYPIVGTYIDSDRSKRLDLQVPVANNRIFFAGEGSHHTQSATVVGAINEGVRAANQIIELQSGPGNPPFAITSDTASANSASDANNSSSGGTLSLFAMIWLSIYTLLSNYTLVYLYLHTLLGRFSVS